MSSGRFQLTLHQKIALIWGAFAPWVLAPAYVTSSREDIGEMLAWGVVHVTVAILLFPVIVRQGVLRRWFRWSDAMSSEQSLALQQRDVRGYYKIAAESGYSERLKPYFYRIGVSGLLGMMLFNPRTGYLFIDGLGLLVLYYIAVMAMMSASVPIFWGRK